MARVRVYELAKEMELSNRELLDSLESLGISVKSHSSTIDQSTADFVRETLRKKREAPAVAPPIPEVAAPVAEAPAIAPPPEEEVSEEELLAQLEREEAEAAPPAPEVERKITLPGAISVKELAAKINRQPSELIRQLMDFNILRSANQTISSDVATKLVEQFGFAAEVQRKGAEPLPVSAQQHLVPIPPVVTIMGHVDHGKTTLLDAIRKTNVAAQEVGSITQSIGAYEVEADGHRIVFLDTPGHEAFTAMRARGAHVTDIAVLVVAADDGVMPQTQEAIDHARAANVPIIVAINKVDLPAANVDRAKQQLAAAGLNPEDWGGDTICIRVSAKQGKGLEELLEMILLVAEMEELRANPRGPATGTIIEAALDPQRGPVATVLVQSGTLRLGDFVVTGSCYGRVRAMLNFKGEPLREATPARPVSIIGLSSVPQASDTLRVVREGKEARALAESYASEASTSREAGPQHVTLEDLFAQIKKGDVKELRLVVKADVQGSVEALCDALLRLRHEEVKITILHRGAGPVGESDVMLAAASNAIIIGFAVDVGANARNLAQREKVEVRLYDVIYRALEDIEAAMAGMLEPVFEERFVGRAEVRALFKSSRAGTIAGCMVVEGKVALGGKLRIVRKGQTVFEGTLDSLRHVREEVEEIPAGMECGIAVSNFNEFEVGDVLEVSVVEEVQRSLRPNRPAARAVVVR